MAKTNDIDLGATAESTFDDGEIEKGSVLLLSHPYNFEDEVIDRLDFSHFEDMTIEDLNRAADALTNAGRVVLNPEMDAQYCMYIAARAARQPHEFFELLGPRDIMRVRNKVRNLFYGRG